MERSTQIIASKRTVVKSTIVRQTKVEKSYTTNSTWASDQAIIRAYRAGCAEWWFPDGSP
jgi:hypothetical protein